MPSHSQHVTRDRVSLGNLLSPCATLSLTNCTESSRTGKKERKIQIETGLREIHKRMSILMF